MLYGSLPISGKTRTCTTILQHAYKRGGGGSLLTIRCESRAWIPAIAVIAISGLFFAGAGHADILPDAFAQSMMLEDVFNPQIDSSTNQNSDEFILYKPQL